MPAATAPARKVTPDLPTFDVLATIAHEFRTPIASLRATVEALVADRESLTGEQAAEMLGRLQRGTVWLQGFVENFLSSASLDAQQLRLRRRPVPLSECIEQVLPMVEPLLARRGQRVDVRGSAETAVDGDPYRLAQVLLNLLMNASKYSVPHDAIELEATTERGTARIRVADHGPGIPEAERELIFVRYARGTRGADTSAGLGLGLTIARALVELHGGQMWAEETPGGGASFYVTLPLAPTARASMKPIGRKA